MRSLLAGSAIGLFATAYPMSAACAQTATNAPASSVASGVGATKDDSSRPGGSTEGALEDIVVTARKRSENLRDVPVALTAVSGDTLPTIPATFGEMGTYSRGRQLGVRLSGRF